MSPIREIACEILLLGKSDIGFHEKRRSPQNFDFRSGRKCVRPSKTQCKERSTPVLCESRASESQSWPHCQKREPSLFCTSLGSPYTRIVCPQIIPFLRGRASGNQAQSCLSCVTSSYPCSKLAPHPASVEACTMGRCTACRDLELCAGRIAHENWTSTWSKAH
jgi:hypothetical protein